MTKGTAAASDTSQRNVQDSQNVGPPTTLIQDSQNVEPPTL